MAGFEWMRGGDVVPRSPIDGLAGVPSRTRGILPAAARSSHRHHGHGRRDNRRASIFLDRRGSVSQCFGSGVAITPRGGMLKNRVRYNRSTEGRVMPSFLEISPDKLSRLIGTPGAPCMIDRPHGRGLQRGSISGRRRSVCLPCRSASPGCIPTIGAARGRHDSPRRLIPLVPRGDRGKPQLAHSEEEGMRWSR